MLACCAAADDAADDDAAAADDAAADDDAAAADVAAAADDAAAAWRRSEVCGGTSTSLCTEVTSLVSGRFRSADRLFVLGSFIQQVKSRVTKHSRQKTARSENRIVDRASKMS